MTKVTINLEDNILVGCLHFTNGPPKLAEAVEATLHAFVTAMQAKGKMPKFTQEVIERTLAQYDEEVSMQDDFLATIRDYLPTEDSAIKAASEHAEKVIELAATPHVKRTFTMDDTVPDTIPLEKETVNLFEINRHELVNLAKSSPKDRFIEQAMGKLLSGIETGAPLSEEDQVFITAVEIVYTGLARSQWGSETAREQIEKLIAIHVGTK